MVTYNVYLEGNFVGTVEAVNTGKALGIVAEKIQSGEWKHTSEPHSISIQPVS